MRRILGNLDYETELAAGAGSPPTLPRAARATAAAAATLLRVFARNDGGDRLWTPSPVAPERLAEVPGLARPTLESGTLANLPRASAILAWGETAAVAGQRPKACRQGDGAVLDELATGEHPLHELVWRLPPADPAVAAAVHHRGFALALADRLGCRLPGAALVSSPAGMRAHLRAQEAGGRPGGTWVVKAPLSAAGRERHLGSAEDLSRGAGGRRVARLFARHGELLVEPWMDRIEDFGAVGILTPAGVRWVGFHRSHNDRRGQPRAIELEARFAGSRWLLAGRQQHGVEEIFGEVARALAGHGYLGPFGIDCWRYRSRGGEIRWNPLGEINARMTLGLLARVLVDRVREPLGIAPDATARLMLGAIPADSPCGPGAELQIPLLFADRRRAAVDLSLVVDPARQLAR